MTPVPTTALASCGFHDAECASYDADLSLWLAIADTVGGPILDLGAGTGRVSVPLALAGHDVRAVDLDGDLLDEAARRAEEAGATISTSVADLRTLDADLGPLDPAPSLLLIPMQTIQLLGGSDARRAMFAAAARVAAPVAELVISVVLEVESFDGRETFPPLLPPDLAFLGGFRFESMPRAVLQDTRTSPIDMHRRRIVRDGLEGAIVSMPEDVVITLDPVDVAGVQA
ncbi:MAG: class I SAM-dependent methyltransferase, partial [Solirubrobacteraceae bacterium]